MAATSTLAERPGRFTVSDSFEQLVMRHRREKRKLEAQMNAMRSRTTHLEQYIQFSNKNKSLFILTQKLNAENKKERFFSRLFYSSVTINILYAISFLIIALL